MEVTDPDSPVYNLALDWSDQAIHYNAHVVDAKYVMYYHPNDLFQTGLYYLTRIMANPSGRQMIHVWRMLNPYKGLTPLLPPRKYTIYENKKKEQLRQNSGKKSHSAVGSKKRKKQTEVDEQEGEHVGQQPD